jgi:predicted RecB family nuclease
MVGGISASTVKSWFQYRCERKTRYDVMEAAEQSAIPLLSDQREQLWAKLGNAYEERIIASLGSQILRPFAGRDILTQEQTRGFLTGSKAERFAWQMNLRPQSAPSLLAGTKLQVRQTKPDLVAVDRSGARPVFTVIDVKATRKATAFHKTQVAFYVRLLELLLKEHGVDAVIDDHGEIWRIPDKGTAEGAAYQVERFLLAPYLRMVDKFCREQIGQIANVPVAPGPGGDKTFFHVYFKCEQCNYLPHCARSIGPDVAPDRRDVSAVAGVSHEAKRALLANGIRTVADLARTEGIGQREGVGWTLQRRADQLRLRAKALVEARPLRSREEHSFLMPPLVDIAIFLVVDHDPVDDMLTSIGLLVRKAGQTEPMIEIIEQPDRDGEADAMCRIFTLLLDALGEIDAHNRTALDNGTATSTTHIFFYEAAEAQNLQRAIGRHLDDPRIRAGLLHIVRIFPPEDVVPEPEFRGAHHLPATAVRNVVEQLYALPVTVSYDLRQVSGALAAAGAVNTPYRPQAGFERPFSALLSIEVIRGLREGKADSPGADAIGRDVADRLAALCGIVDWLFTQDAKQHASGSGGLLRLNKKPFVFHASFNPLDVVDLDVLRAMEVLESRAGLLEALIGLAQPASQRRDAGRCIGGIKMTANRRHGFGGAARQRLSFYLPPESRVSDIAPGDMGLILTDDDPDMRLDPSLWQDCTVNLWRRQPGRDQFLTLDMPAAAFDSPAFQRMFNRSAQLPVWHIDRSFTDINGPRAARFIGALIGPAQP